MRFARFRTVSIKLYNTCATRIEVICCIDVRYKQDVTSEQKQASCSPLVERCATLLLDSTAPKTQIGKTWPDLSVMGGLREYDAGVT